jgi:hypothetical protein
LLYALEVNIIVVKPQLKSNLELRFPGFSFSCGHTGIACSKSVFWLDNLKIRLSQPSLVKLGLWLSLAKAYLNHVVKAQLNQIRSWDIKKMYKKQLKGKIVRTLTNSYVHAG